MENILLNTYDDKEIKYDRKKSYDTGPLLVICAVKPKVERENDVIRCWADQLH
jgi:hypothetical protein